MGDVTDLAAERDARAGIGRAVQLTMPTPKPVMETAPGRVVTVRNHHGQEVFIHHCATEGDEERMVLGVMTPPEELPFIVAALMEALDSMGHPVVPAEVSP